MCEGILRSERFRHLRENCFASFFSDKTLSRQINIKTTLFNNKAEIWFQHTQIIYDLRGKGENLS